MEHDDQLATLVNAKLKALAYIALGTFSLQKPEEVAKMVLWLENRKIRQYPAAERGGLAYSSSWGTHFEKYLKVLECPVPSDSQARCCHWLLAHAISLEYYDNASQINATPKQNAQTVDGITKAKSKLSEAEGNAGAIESPEVVKLLDEILTSLKIAPNTTKNASAMEKLRTIYHTVQRLQDALTLSKTNETFKTASFPLGFHTGDTITDEAATIMRMLYVEDLQDLQRSVNAMLSHAQKYTANPKTNSKLGRVGR